MAVRLRFGRTTAQGRPGGRQKIFRDELRPLCRTQPGRRDGRAGHRLLRAAVVRKPNSRQEVSLCALRRARRSAGGGPGRPESRTEGHAPARPDAGQEDRAVLHTRRDRTRRRRGARPRTSLGGGSDRTVFPAGAGFGPRETARRGNRAGRLRRTQWPSLQIHRPGADRSRRIVRRQGFHAGHQAMGKTESRHAAPAAAAKSRLCFLPGTAGPGSRPHRRARSRVDARTQHRRGSCRPPSGRAGLSFLHLAAFGASAEPPDAGAGHRQCHQGCGAGGFFLGIRG